VSGEWSPCNGWPDNNPTQPEEYHTHTHTRMQTSAGALYYLQDL